MKRLTLVACVALAAIFLPLRAVAQHPVHADSAKATLTISEDVVVGTSVLKPGDYRFQCKTIDGKTFMVVTAQDSGKEVTRVPCVFEKLDEKIAESQFRTLKADGKRTLTVVRIKGETAQHRVAVN